jgi:hypothetical protein
VVINVKFSVSKYTQILVESVRVYGGLAKFIIIDQYVSFPEEGYNSTFAGVEFHIVSSAPTLYRVKVRL